jgi:hypothetical protein
VVHPSAQGDWDLFLDSLPGERQDKELLVENNLRACWRGIKRTLRGAAGGVAVWECEFAREFAFVLATQAAQDHVLITILSIRRRQDRR